MTVIQSINDERNGGDFLASMTDIEFQKFQREISKQYFKKRRHSTSNS